MKVESETATTASSVEHVSTSNKIIQLMRIIGFKNLKLFGELLSKEGVIM